SYPVYQANLRGAAAVLAVQQNGYGEVNSAALNAQNISGPADAPAFSLSRADADRLRSLTGGFGGEAQVLFDARSTITRAGVSYNISGRVRGRDPDSMILLSAHYDSYFSGFQDDNAAVAMMLGIARALVASGYQPRHTFLFCALAAEEWGISDSKYDWSTGAYNQIFRVRPDWVGKIIADINFELPACAHGVQDVIRGVYEYSGFLKQFVEKRTKEETPFSGGVSVAAPVLTWSDDFSMAIAGVPSLVNDFSDGSFMETHYHSQFDNAEAYDPEIYAFHHALYGALALAFDRCAAAPLDFTARFAALIASVDTALFSRAGVDSQALLAAAKTALICAEECAIRTEQFNRVYDSAEGEAADCAYSDAAAHNAALLRIFRRCEDAFVRLGWHDEILFPHEYAQRNLLLLERADAALTARDVPAALDALMQIDVNRYACFFDRPTCRHFTDYVLHQPPERLMWGAGRLVGLCDLGETVRTLQGKQGDAGVDLQAERGAVADAAREQRAVLGKTAERER
ncbi:MAG: M28 family peptidase, partial [Pygmaiobacter sp.]